jgi:hypothetical protein
MIVPTMSLPEIGKSVSNDYACEIKSKLQSINATYRGKWIRNGRKDFVETILFPVKSKNNWRITITCNNNGVNAVPYLISYNHIGITASHVPFYAAESTSLMHFNTHFFKRYRERGMIAIEKPEDLVKFFFKKNPVLISCYYPREDGTLQLFTPLAGGVGLGNYYEDTDICEFKTFVDNSLLGKNQQEAIFSIWTDTLKDITDEMKRRMDKRAERKL